MVRDSLRRRLNRSFPALRSLVLMAACAAGGAAHSRKPKQAAFAQLLLERRADPNARASLREPVDTHEGRVVREHRDITPLRWGEVFQNRMAVSDPAMRVIAERGGQRKGDPGAEAVLL